ncbi:MAG: hypothetical protein ACO1N9_01135 [Flavobacterium sp.]
MFDKICIKEKSSEGYKLDVGFLIDTLLFYGRVVILVHKKELALLIRILGEDLLKTLITTGRIELKIKQNHLGSMIFPGGRYNVDTFSSKDENLEGILYEAHRSVVNNSTKNSKFAADFSKITDSYSYPQSVRENIISDFNNRNLLTKTLPVYLNTIIPEYQLPDNIEIEIIREDNFGPYEGYSLNTNINMEELNNVYKSSRPEVQYDIDYSGFLLSMAESKGDIQIASDMESELVTSDLYSKFIAIELQEIILQRANSQQQLDLFHEYILKDCSSFGYAYMNGIISGKELLEILDKADKFREWLKNIPQDKNLLGEYHAAVITKELSDKLPTKTARFFIFEGIGVTLDLLGAGGLGTAAAVGLSFADNFLLDKIINRRWKPNQFIDNTLKPAIKIR